MKEFVLSGAASDKQIDLEQELNDEQREVVLQGDGPCLVLAGAGSGKTRTITYRVAYLLQQGVAPQNILLLTFTNKASSEMISRVESICGSYPAGLWAGTFHSIANRLLRQYAANLGFTSDFTILDREDSESLIKKSIKELKIDTKASRFPSAKVLMSIISYSRNAGCDIKEAIGLKHPHFEHLRQSIEMVSEQYRKKKKEGNMMDFDDLLLKFLELLTDHQDVANRLSEQFQYILVDEFQDTNTVQASIVRILAKAHQNIFVVGDDAQSIYSFRAANIQNILRFSDRFPGTKTFKLTTNYRSTPEILSLANASIANNRDQYQKDLRALSSSLDKPHLVPAQGVRQEAQYIAEQILDLYNDNLEFRNIAVLFRSAFHSQQLELELAKRDIPYEYRGGLRFFERAHIKDVVSYLRIISNVKDEVAWIRVLSHQPGVGLITAGKIFESVRGHESLREVVESEPKVSARGKAGWNGFTRIARDMGLEKLPAEIIRKIAKSDYRDYLEATYPEFMDRLEDIEQFALFAEQYDNLSDFLAEVTLQDDYGAARDDQDARDRDRIILSTIHQSKGLEWDAVFVMRLSDGGFPHARSLEENGAIEEERRLFYVAVTRARKHLFLTYPLYSGFETLMLNQPSTFIQEVSKSLLEEVRLRRPTAPNNFGKKSNNSWGSYQEPTIVLDPDGERLTPFKEAPSSFLRDV